MTSAVSTFVANLRALLGVEPTSARRSRPASIREQGSAFRRDGKRSSGELTPDALKGLEELERRAPPIESYEDALGDGGYRANSPAGRGEREPPHYWGHRERLRQRFLKGPDAVPDYEILELVLFNAIPRIDVKPHAKKLLAEFGDLGQVLAAPESRLLQVPGMTPKVVVQFRLALEIAARLARLTITDRCVLSSYSALIEYCRTAMAHRETEQFRALFLDNKNRLIVDEALGEGTLNAAPVYPREIARRALQLNAASLILVHNHPSGDPTPSDNDVKATRQIRNTLEAVGVQLHDHVVIGRSGEASLKTMRLI
jgi:DNA repair protein RadC